MLLILSFILLDCKFHIWFKRPCFYHKNASTELTNLLLSKNKRRPAFAERRRRIINQKYLHYHLLFVTA